MKASAVTIVLLLAPGVAIAQSAPEWPIVVEHAPENAATCAPGTGAAAIRVHDGSLSLVFASFPQPIWTVKPAPDGSFDAVVPSYADANGVRIMVPAGAGPRPIQTRQQGKPCAYRLVPK